MKLTRKGKLLLIALPLFLGGSVVGMIPVFVQPVPTMNGASILGVLMIFASYAVTAVPRPQREQAVGE